MGEVNTFMEKPGLGRFAERGRSSWVVGNSVHFAGKASGSAPHTHTRWEGVKPAAGVLPPLWWKGNKKHRNTLQVTTPGVCVLGISKKRKFPSNLPN